MQVNRFEFSFSKIGRRTKMKEPSFPYYFFIDGGIKVECIPFSNVLALCEMQKALYMIWTRFSVSRFYDNNHRTTYMYVYVCILCLCI